MEYLDFELPIKELEDQLDKCLVIGQESDIDVTNTCKQINKKLEETKRLTQFDDHGQNNPFIPEIALSVLISEYDLSTKLTLYNLLLSVAETYKVLLSQTAMSFKNEVIKFWSELNVT